MFAPSVSRLVVVLLLAAAMVRGVLPTGYMFAPSADAGSIVVEMCVIGTHAYRLDLTTGKTSPIDDPLSDGGAPQTQSASDCPFALAASPVLSGGQTSLPLPVKTAPADLEVLRHVAERGPAAGLPPPARGPPQLI